MRSGYVNLTAVNEVFRGSGGVGYVWSSRASNIYNGTTSLSAYFLTLSPTTVSPSAGPGHRHAAFPLRCLSTVLDM